MEKKFYKSVLFSTWILFSYSALADAPGKSWKTFDSGFGYQFRYPDCWKATRDDDSSSVTETAKCKRREWTVKPSEIDFFDRACTDKDREVPDSEKKWREEVLTRRLANDQKDVETILNKSSKQNLVGIRDLLLFKKLKLNSDAQVLVYMYPAYIEWQITLFCADRWISMTGPQLATPRMGLDQLKDLFFKFKSGDLGLSEPEKTIIESVQCVPEKVKRKHPFRFCRDAIPWF